MKMVFPKLNTKQIIMLIILDIFVLISTLVKNASPILMLVILLWLYLLFLTISDIKNNIALFCFLIAYFVFLVGREVCFQYLSVEVYYKYLVKENTFTYFCLIISLIGIWCGTYIKNEKKDKNNSYYVVKEHSLNIQIITELIFLLCYCFLIVTVIAQIVLVRSVGYLASYTDEAVSTNIPRIVSYIAAFTPVIFCVFLSSYPSKKKVILPIVLYEIYAVLTVLTGKRYPFIAINMIILIYITIRSKNEKGWMSKKVILLLIIAIPFLIVFLVAYDSIRLGETFKVSNITNIFIDFFDSQGGSVNVIKRVKYYENDLSDLFLTSFENTRNAIFENAIARKITNVQVYSGNSIERALHGNSLMHRLSYYSYGSTYLTGRGVGSCYIAELYHDFGYVGIFFGSMFYGWLIKCVSNIRFNHYLRDGIVLAIMYYLLLAPRGNFDGFIEGVFGLYSLLGILTTYIIIKLVNQKLNRGK